MSAEKLMADSAQNNILFDIRMERKRQDEKWGSQREHSGYKWATILGEEFGEACKEVFDADYKGADTTKLRAELIQVAAVAVCWLEGIDKE